MIHNCDSGSRNIPRKQYFLSIFMEISDHAIMYFENMKFKINLMEFNSNYNFFFFQIFNMHKKNRGCYVRVYYISLTT